ncbi:MULTISPECIES: hypothetical protein [Streptomyces]|uniref:Secreted protein n=1 Tax=Streptomyces lasiicapitis TaxID=1923961 RepID=A0ABQ2M431_9ACTN|nr:MULTISPECIES: hypothetical protein [Streptomyces]GGO46925.1 hypothetical protein GCM10012286_38980 [Streptomyces lasiicapitis]
MVSAARMDRVRASEEGAARLRAELAEVGVVLPSLRVDPLTVASGGSYPLVDLGRCNLDTALRLTAVLYEARRGTGPAAGAEASPGDVLRARVRELNREGRLP